MWLSSIGNFAHTVECLQYWQPTVFTNGTIGTNGITNGTIGRTLNDIGIPLVPLVEPWTHALSLTGGEIIVNQSNLGNSCGLYLFFSSVTYTGSLIFIEPGTIQCADVSPPRSDISRYAQVIFPLRIDDFHCFLLCHPMNSNYFFRHFNCVNTQIRSLIRVLWEDSHCLNLSSKRALQKRKFSVILRFDPYLTYLCTNINDTGPSLVIFLRVDQFYVLRFLFWRVYMAAHVWKF